jgi:hypothetical protein
MNRRIYISGEKIGRCIFIKEVESKRRRGMFICECGNEFEAQFNHIVSGQSCGCRKKQSIHHLVAYGFRGNLKTGLAVLSQRTKGYNTWNAMKSRCYNSNNPRYQDYGGRGIEICDRWRYSFENFINDMGIKPIGHSIDRIDVNGSYEPSNCKWATGKEQNSNKRYKK